MKVVDSNSYRDPRYKIVSDQLGVSRFDIIGRMGLIWEWVTRKQTYYIDKKLFDALTELPGLFEACLQSDLLRKERRRIYVVGSRKSVEWYGVLKVNSIRGGEATRNKYQQNPFLNQGQKAGQAASQAEYQSSPSPSPVLKKENIYTAEHKTENEDKNTKAGTKESLSNEVKICLELWKETLLGRGFSNPRTQDDARLARLIQRHGFDDVKLAVIGMRQETSNASFDSNLHFHLGRLNKEENIARFRNLGEKYERTQRDQTSVVPRSGLDQGSELTPDLSESGNQDSAVPDDLDLSQRVSPA